MAAVLLAAGAGAETPEIEVLPESDYVETERCIREHTYQLVEVLDEQRLVFKGLRGRVWLNQLQAPCVGLRRGMVLEFSRRDHRLCELDSVRGLDEARLAPMSARCMLGEFEPISQEQLELLEDLLKQR